MPAGDATAGAPCCRLAATHQPTRRGRRYPSDVTDAQWALLDPLLPDPAWLGGRGGRREKHCRRVIVDAIAYVVDNGIKWRALPADFPPWPTVYKRFAIWEKAGATQRMANGLRDRARLAAGRVAAPSAAVIDSQSVRAAATVGRATRGVGRGQEGQRPQAAHRGGHRRVPAGGAGDAGLGPGPGRRPRAVAAAARDGR